MSLYLLPTFVLATCFCRSDHEHGGVAIFTKNGLDAVELSHIKSMSVEKDCEVVGIHLRQQKSVILVVYRSPNGDRDVFLATLEDIMTSVINQVSADTRVIMAGDFNVDFLENTPIKRDMIKIMNNFGMMQTIYHPTRIRCGSQSCIDNIFTNTTGIPNALVLKYTSRRIYSQKQMDKFDAYLSTYDWTTIHDSNPQQMCGNVIKVLRLGVEKSFPIKACKHQKTTPISLKKFNDQKEVLKFPSRL